MFVNEAASLAAQMGPYTMSSPSGNSERPHKAEEGNRVSPGFPLITAGSRLGVSLLGWSEAPARSIVAELSSSLSFVMLAGQELELSLRRDDRRATSTPRASTSCSISRLGPRFHQSWIITPTAPDLSGYLSCRLGLPGGSDSKESACSVGDLGLIPGQEDPLEKGKATHSSILSWRIPWTEEPSRLRSMRLQRVGHD